MLTKKFSHSNCFLSLKESNRSRKISGFTILLQLRWKLFAKICLQIDFGKEYPMRIYFRTNLIPNSVLKYTFLSSRDRHVLKLFKSCES